MYNLIDQIGYSQYNQQLLKRLTASLKEEPCFIGFIIYQEMIMIINDYALFLSFYDKYENSGNVHQVVHLGENSLFRMSAIWEHIGFILHLYFHKYMFFINKKGEQVYFKKKDVTFSLVIKSLIKNANATSLKE